MPNHRYEAVRYIEESPIRLSNVKRLMLLEELLRSIALQGYNFTTVTPLTHERFLLGFDGLATNARDVFGWNLPFKATILPPLIFKLMTEADLLFNGGECFRSKIRISSLGEDVFLHSHFPTNDLHAVFFGPDTYRFARFVRHSLRLFQFQPGFADRSIPIRVLDVGCGSGAGGIAAIRSLPMNQLYELTLNDLNPTAVDYARVCANVAGIPVNALPSDFFNIRGAEFDLIISNPPYLSDPAARLYRDGGSHLGLELSLRIAKHALTLLAPGGHLLLYTGMAITSDDNNPLLSELLPYLSGDKFQWSYEEIDPDVFGEELEQPDYKRANRIAAVGLTVMRTK